MQKQKDKAALMQKKSEEKKSKQRKGRKDMYKSQIPQKEEDDHDNSGIDKEAEEFKRYFLD